VTAAATSAAAEPAGIGVRPPTGGTALANDWLGRPPVDRPQRAWQKRKNPTLAMLSSFTIPGLGQLYNERPFWAAVAAGVEAALIGDIIIQQRLTNRYRTLKNEPIDPNLPEDEREREEQEREDATVLFLLHQDNRVQSTWLLGLTVLLSGLQAFVDAHLFDFDENASLQLGPALGDVPGAALRVRF
jgi:hypothetical protein